MNPTHAAQPVAVLAMRGQVPRLHEGHRHAIDRARERSGGRALIAIGDHGGFRTDRDPLTFAEREVMFREDYPDEDVVIARLRDHPFDHMRWSDWLDALCEQHFPGAPAIMCGSRDSFLDLYTGRHGKFAIDAIDVPSGTQYRKSILQSAGMSAREAIIHHEMTRSAAAYSAADVAIVDDENERVMAITKHWFDGLWSLCGGFVSPEKDEDDEGAARREHGEELPGIRTNGVYEQMGPRIRVDDPRYRRSKDKIYAQLFCTQYAGGVSNGGDDAKGARWMSRSDLERFMVPWHRPQIERVLARWDRLRANKAA